MSILFDLEATQPVRGQTHGGAEYAKVLFGNLLSKVRPGDIKGHYDPRRRLEDDVRSAASAGHVDLLESTTPSSLGRLAAEAACKGYVSVLPYNLHGADLSGLDVWLTLHGLRHFESPVDDHGWRYAQGVPDLAKWAIKRMVPGAFAARQRRRLQGVLTLPSRTLTIIVPSQHTRFAIRDVYPGLDPAGLRIIYCPETAVSRVDPSPADVLTSRGLERGRYVLIVSGGKWIKNAYRALEAAIGVIESTPRGSGLKVALAGGAPKRLPSSWRPHIVELGRLSAPDLAAAYANALCLMYPTLNEGFGYPPLEAMARGTPVLCSAVTSTTEILGDAVVYFDPHSVAEMRNRLRMILEDGDLHESFAARGRARYEIVAHRQELDQARLCDLILGSVTGP